MEILFMNEESCIFSEEDYIFNIKWKVSDLICQGYPEDVLMTWENNKTWYTYARLFIKTNDKRKI